jgi:hypothetical protein
MSLNSTEEQVLERLQPVSVVDGAIHTQEDDVESFLKNSVPSV